MAHPETLGTADSQTESKPLVLPLKAEELIAFYRKAVSKPLDPEVLRVLKGLPANC